MVLCISATGLEQMLTIRKFLKHKTTHASIGRGLRQGKEVSPASIVRPKGPLKPAKPYTNPKLPFIPTHTRKSACMGSIYPHHSIQIGQCAGYAAAVYDQYSRQNLRTRSGAQVAIREGYKAPHNQQAKKNSGVLNTRPTKQAKRDPGRRQGNF
jgi:hypothetical protein